MTVWDLRSGDVLRGVPNFESPVLVRDTPVDMVVPIAILDDKDELLFTGSMLAESIQAALDNGAFADREGGIVGH